MMARGGSGGSLPGPGYVSQLNTGGVLAGLYPGPNINVPIESWRVLTRFRLGSGQVSKVS
jgi:hypothetical protein